MTERKRTFGVLWPNYEKLLPNKNRLFKASLQVVHGFVKVYRLSSIWKELRTPNPYKPEIRSTKFEIRNKSKIEMFECSKHGI